ncbi:diguanylate cyclase [Agromyces sp. NPDC056523]|uniref:sensor domain-containing protein n=1 Tax=Agromyces sp. NPDC056523 TaxID=3345850 RepID=UPI00366E5C5A
MGSGEDELRQSYADLFHGAPCGYLTTTADGVITRANRTLVSWTGLSEDDLLGTSLVDLLTPAGQLFYEARYATVLRLAGEVREVALSIRCADGRDLPVLVNAVIVPERDGFPEEVRTAIFDATERQDYERQLLVARRQAEASEARVRVLQDASSAFGLAMNAQELGEALISAARTGLLAAGAAILLQDEHGGQDLIADGVQVDPLISAGLMDLAAQAIEGDEVVTVSSLDQAAAIRPDLDLAMQDQRLAALSIAPLRGDSSAQGVVVCFYGRDQVFDDETRDIHAALARQAAQVLRRVRLQEELAHRALHDQLTGLANRKLLQERLEAALAGAQRDGRPLSIVFIDLDGFKPINDALGHRIGDEVLVEVADRLRGAARASDPVARYGGDEFVIVCENADAEAAGILAERFRHEIGRPLTSVPPRYAVAASLGVATWTPDDGSDPPEAERLIRLADEAMYASKRRGRDRVTSVTA